MRFRRGGFKKRGKMKKAISGRNYGSIPHLLDSKLGDHDKYIHEGQDAIIRKGGRDKHDAVYVSLKLDGTNVGVARKGDQLIPVQRKGYDCRTSPYEQHHKFADFVEDHRPQFLNLLKDGERIAGEWIYQASGIQYELSELPFVPFDIFNASGEREPWLYMCAWVESVSDFCPPFFLERKFKDHFRESSRDLEMLGTDFHARPMSCDLHEGLVYRVERKGKFDFMAKWVRQDFHPGKYLPGVRNAITDGPVLNTIRS